MRTPPKTSVTYGLLESLGHEIVTGEYEGRPFPTEAELSERYRASRSVTREAVKMLTAKGLLSARPRHGTVIEPESEWNLLDPDVLRWLLERKFSMALLSQFTEMRLGIEPTAAALAAQRADAAAIDKIGHALERMRSAQAGHDDATLSDIAFHAAILEATNNPFYAQLYEMVNTALHISIHFTNGIQGHTGSLPDHEAVFTAIAAHDPDAARSHMHRIVADVLELVQGAQSLAAAS